MLILYGIANLDLIGSFSMSFTKEHGACDQGHQRRGVEVKGEELRARFAFQRSSGESSVKGLNINSKVHYFQL